MSVVSRRMAFEGQSLVLAVLAPGIRYCGSTLNYVRSCLVSEMAAACEDHGHAVFVAGGDDFFVIA